MSSRFCILLSILVLGSATLSAAPECIVSCTYEEIVAPLGTAGEIGIQIQQRDAQIQTSSMAQYVIVGIGVQILDETPWNAVGESLYEKRVVVSLSEVGEGALSFRNGEESEDSEMQILPIRVLTPLVQGRWASAMAGLYPLEGEYAEDVLSVHGKSAYVHGILFVEDIACEWPLQPRRLAESEGEIRLFYIERDGMIVPLLAVGETFFYRCDHLLAQRVPPEE